MNHATKTHSHTPHFRTAHRTPRSLRSAACLGLGLLSLLSLSAGTVAHAGTVNWDNTPGDWFSSPSHWDNGAYPGATDDAVNMSTAAMTLGQSTTINSFFSNGAFTLQGGTFSGNQANAGSTLQVNNVFTVDGGQINNFTVNQGTGGSVVFTGSGGNSISNSIINANLDLATNSNAYLDMYGAVTENGNINLGTTSNGLRLVYSDANLTLGSAGSLTGFGNVYQYSSTQLNNNGLVNANSPATPLTLAVSTFNNNGTAEATNGATLNLNNTNTNNNGTISAAGSGSIASLTGTITSGANSLFTTSNGGQIQVNGANLLGTINTSANTALVFSNSGNNQINNGGSGATINGNLDMATHTDAALDLFGGVTENGNINLGTTSNGLRLVYSDANLTLGSAGSLTGFGSVSQYSSTQINNNGTVNANVNGQALNLAVSTFTNNATAEATNGATLNLNNTSTVNNGTLTAKSGGIVNLNGGTVTNSIGSLLDGAGGTFNVNGADLIGTITGTAGTSLVFNNSGSNQINAGGSGATINTNLDMATNTAAYLDMYGSVTENGNINLGTSGNGLRLVYSDADLTLGSAGSLTGFGSVYQYSSTQLNNNGLINANSAASPLTLAVSTFNNNGTTEATNGATLSLNNTNTNGSAGSAIVANGAGSVVSLTGTYTGTGNSLFTTSNGGQLQVNGADLLGMINTDASTALVFNSSGNNQINAGGSGATINGNLDMATHADAYLDMYGAVAENGNINLGTTSNGLRLVYSDANLTLGSAGSLTGFGNVSQYSSTQLTNNGLVNANSATTPLTLAVSTFNNNGTAEATNGATLSLNNTNTNNNAALNAAGPGSVVAITGTLTGAGSNLMTASNGGQIQINGATLLGTINTDANTALVLNDSSSNNINGATINGNLDLATHADAYLDVYGAVTENGNINLGTTSNGLRLVYSDANLTLGSAGSLTGFGNVSQYSSTALINNGTVNANVSGQALNINTSNFANTGTVQVQNGAALNVTSANTDSGNILVQTGGTATFTQGLTQTGGLTQVNGTLNSPLTLTGGTLAGTGTVNGNVANNGGTVSAGNSSNPFGTLAVSGPFSQTSGALDAVFSSTQNSLLAVTGAVLTGGALNVSYLGAGPYTGSGPFTFLDYGSLTSSITGATPGQTQYFSNETFQNGEGIIDGSNGFVYELLNNANADGTGGLQLEVLQNGAPTPAVPEASTTVSMGLLLLFGSGLVLVKRRRTASSAA